jgi:trehalose 6-phosphate phosphatase
LTPDPLAPIRATLDRSLLAFDFDGTFAPIVARPEDALPAEGVLALLTELAGRVARLAIITGRPAETVIELGGLAAIPNLTVLGHYGLQHWENGVLTSPSPEPGVALVRAALAGLLPAGAMIEDKEQSVVVHTRACADPDAALAAIEVSLQELAAAHGLEVVPGRAVRELRPPGVDKGGALKSLVAEVKPASVLVAGDDVGDLPLFAAAGELSVPAVRIAVVSAGAAPEVAAAADLTVDGPAALVALLQTL